VIFALAYNALLVYGLMWFAWFWILQRLDAGIASLGTLAVPVIGVLAGMVVLGERPTALEWAGIALIVSALLTTTSIVARGGR
jgi:drug/metabolite transporter (DMT)-like permease